MLSAELDDHLESEGAEGAMNRRNGSSRKTMLTGTSKVTQDVPRDRAGTFDDERTAARPDPENRRHCRYQVQGPNANKVIEAATGKPAPELKFFNMLWMEIGGKQVHALRHGMAGQPGYELMGPWDDRDAVHAALVEAGSKHGMAPVDGRT